MELWRPSRSCISALCLLVFLCLQLVLAQHRAIRPRSFHAVTDDDAIRRLADLSDQAAVLDYQDPDSLLARILIPRPPGSQNLTRCRGLFRDHFASLSTTIPVPHEAQLYDPSTHEQIHEIRTWHLEQHPFTDTTPYGEQEFINQIFTHDPTATLKLVIAAHIDSKYFPSYPANQFVGATDSAAPVAMILQAVKALTPLLDAQLRKRTRGKAGRGHPEEERVTLQVVLLDGEEAFMQWTDADSIYGARALAEKWSSPQGPPTPYSRGRNTLDTIQTFVLLDLLGAADPFVQNYYAATTWLYDAWSLAEQRLGSAGILWPGQLGPAWATGQAPEGRKHRRAFFRPHPVGQTSFYGGISDDHLPFLAGGVPILHLIAFPFPKVWHTLADDASALDPPTIRAWTLITQLALAEYFGLEEYLGEVHRRSSHTEL